MFVEASYFGKAECAHTDCEFLLVIGTIFEFWKNTHTNFITIRFAACVIHTSENVCLRFLHFLQHYLNDANVVDP